MLIVPLVVPLLLGLFHSAVAQAARWQPPLAGARIAREFDFDARAPFTRGAVRGVRLAAEPGALVRAPCRGRVGFAGRHPRLGIGVSLRCGSLVATELGLERAFVREGAGVRAGSPVGRLGANGLLHLGARVEAERFGYLDPLTLIDSAVRPPTLAPPARPSSRRGEPRSPAVAPRVRQSALAHPSSRSPLLAWFGTALAATAAGFGTALCRGRRARSKDDTTSISSAPAARKCSCGCAAVTSAGMVVAAPTVCGCGEQSRRTRVPGPSSQ